MHPCVGVQQPTKETDERDFRRQFFLHQSNQHGLLINRQCCGAGPTLTGSRSGNQLRLWGNKLATQI